MKKCEYRSCGFLFFNDSQVKLHYWQMHPEYVNPGMNKINISHGEEAEVRHPEVQGSDAKSDLSVGNHPGKLLDYQESNQEVGLIKHGKLVTRVWVKKRRLKPST